MNEGPAFVSVPGNADPSLGSGQQFQYLTLLRHLCHVHRESRLREQRGQFEYSETVAADFGLPVDAWLGVRGFVTALQVVEELLGLAGAGFGDLARVTTASVA